MSTSHTVSSALDAMFEREDGLYGSFEDLPVISQMGHSRRVELLERLEIGDVRRMRVADFGMGSWGFASVYPRLHDCAAAIGMDISNAAIDLSRKLIAETCPKYAAVFKAHQSDGMRIPLHDASVDLFFSGESIEHVKFPLAHLSEIYRVLGSGGQLIVTTPNRDAVKYKAQGEEYCTSPEHFWLFNYEELVETISEFFDIQECYGFNGSFGSHQEDRDVKDAAIAREWSRQFEHDPQLATGIVLRATKRPNVGKRYVVSDIPRQSIKVEGSDTYLDLEFGLKGLLMDKPGQSITVRRPASQGIVLRFWSHRWSGIAKVGSAGRQSLIDLYTFVPGWKNWVCDELAITQCDISITPCVGRNLRAEGTQTLFFEAFTWDIVFPTSGKQESLETMGPSLAMRGYGFERFKPFVATTVFHWFEPNEGNVRGPWQPLNGRASWTGKADFWREQIKQMMLANIDAIYLHCIDQFEGPRVEFFKAYAQLRADGFDVPKVAPFLDPNILFGQPGRATIDVATDQGKDEFARHYIRFFEQYFRANADSDAGSYLLTIDGKLVLATWWVCHLLQNVQAMTREDVESRLSADLGTIVPQLATGIYMVTTAMIDPDLSFADERMVAFSGYAYAIHCVHQSVDSWHVQPGYWDQNIRQPGYLLPRDGGKNYRRAWDAVVSANPHRVYIESWNEYDEGSGIYAADPSRPLIDRSMHSNEDTFSDRGEPYEYVLTTAEGASRINRKPEFAAQVIWHDAPIWSHAGARARIPAGSQLAFKVVIRNTGNGRWQSVDDFALSLLDESDTAAWTTMLAACFPDEFKLHGIYRGAPVTFSVSVTTPVRQGNWTLKFVFTHRGSAIGHGPAIAFQINA